MLTIKVDGENFMEIPLMGDVEIFIEDRLIWKNKKEPDKKERESFKPGDKLIINFISYQDYKIVHGIKNNNKKDYNNTKFKPGDIVTFVGYGNIKSSCETESSWIYVTDLNNPGITISTGIIDILCEKI